MYLKNRGTYTTYVHTASKLKIPASIWTAVTDLRTNIGVYMGLSLPGARNVRAADLDWFLKLNNAFCSWNKIVITSLIYTQLKVLTRLCIYMSWIAQHSDWATGWKTGVRFLARWKFSFSYEVQTGFCVYTVYYPFGSWALYQWLKRPARKIDHLPLSSAEANKECSNTFTPPHVFISWLLSNTRDNCTFINLCTCSIFLVECIFI
jgi:hypothetical protein